MQDSLEANDVQNQQVSTEFLGEVAAAQNFRRRTGARPLLVDLRRSGMLVREIDVTRKEQCVIRLRARAVPDDVASPGIKDVSVGIGESERDIHVGLLRARLVPKDGSVRHAPRRSPRSFNLRVMERPFLHVDGSAGIQYEAVDRMVRIGGVEPVDQTFLDVVFVVAVRVFQEQQIRPLGHQDAAVPEFESGRVVNVAGERGAFVGFAVTIGVFQDQQAIVHLFGRLPVRIRAPAGDPEPPLGVERHLHRLDQFGEHRFVSEQFDLHVLMNGHLVDRFLPGQEQVLAIRQRPRFIGNDWNELGQVRVVGFGSASLSGRPDNLVSLGRQRVEHVEFPLADGIVRKSVAVSARTFGELQERTIAIRRISVGDAITHVPVEVLISNGSIQPFQGGSIMLDHRAVRK